MTGKSCSYAKNPEWTFQGALIRLLESIRRYSYFYTQFANQLSFLIPKNLSILYYGRNAKRILPALFPKYWVAVYSNSVETQQGNKTSIPSYDSYSSDEKFDYIILESTISECSDIAKLIASIEKFCTPSTRIIVYQHNYLWQKILNLAELLGLKEKEDNLNWLSVGDLKAYLTALDFEPTHCFRFTLFPLQLGFVGPLLNGLFDLLPLLDTLKLNQFIIARKREQNLKPASLTICITVRDEKKNIEPLVQSLFPIAPQQEIVFVEGHSTDGTAEEVERMKRSYPEKNIRLLKQTGIGQGDAIRLGFSEAMGDVILLYEGDGTSSPEDLIPFYDCLSRGTLEFIEGSRFVYPNKKQNFTILKYLGNILFAKWFSFFLRQNVTDVLSGIKGIKKSDFLRLQRQWGFLGVKDPFGDFELLYGAARLGLKIGEIPIHYSPRTYGESKSRVWHHGKILAHLCWRGYRSFRSALCY